VNDILPNTHQLFIHILNLTKIRTMLCVMRSLFLVASSASIAAAHDAPHADLRSLLASPKRLQTTTSAADPPQQIHIAVGRDAATEVTVQFTTNNAPSSLTGAARVAYSKSADSLLRWYLRCPGYRCLQKGPYRAYFERKVKRGTL
jgi:hypothetical protein